MHNSKSVYLRTENAFETETGSEIIDIVQNYTYLGTRISSSGNFTLSLEHRQKALHAFFGLRRHTDFNKLKPKRNEKNQKRKRNDQKQNQKRKDQIQLKPVNACLFEII